MNQRLGINAHLPANWLIDKVADLGVQWMRCDFNWDHIQASGPDHWDWELTDAIVQHATSRGLSIYPTLSHTPAWANHDAGRGSPPTLIMHWVTFVTEVAKRYQGQIKVWGIWNEWQGNVSDYIRLLLQPAHASLRQVDPLNLIAGPDLATTGSWDTWLRDFLDRVVHSWIF